MKSAMNCDELAAAEVCFVVASDLLYLEPAIESVVGQMESRQFEEAPYASGNPAVREGLSLLDKWCSDALAAAQAELGEGIAETPLAESAELKERVGALRREWLRLFIGLGEPEAPCSESFYIDPNRSIFTKTTLEVREAYRRHGLQVERLNREPDDHLGLMLGFLSRLMDEESQARAAGDNTAADALADEQERFMVVHVLPWISVWRYNVKKNATSDYFRGVGEFVFGLVACYAERFGIRYDEESQSFKKR